MKVHNFRELIVWQKAMDLAVHAYLLTGYFPREEKYGLISQIQRSAISIPSNIAEGCGRITAKDFQHFIAIAMGSSFEMETQLILACRIGYLKDEQLKEFELAVGPVQRMLNGLYDSMKDK
jgi:four helix bundle protein